MAVYENKCRACGHEFETQQSIKDTKRPRCPRCRSPRTVRLISKNSFALKGDWGHG